MKKDSKFKDDLNTSFIYLSYRNSFDLGFVNYKIFKKRIHYILNSYDFFYIRQIFQELVFQKKIERIKTNKILYRFNPYFRNSERINLTVNF